MDPYHTKALYWLANENALRGNDEEAIRLYERSLSRPPFYLSALMNLGLLYEGQRKLSRRRLLLPQSSGSRSESCHARLYLKDIDAASDMYYDEDMLRNQSRLRQILEIPVTDSNFPSGRETACMKMGIQNLGDLTRIPNRN